MDNLPHMRAMVLCGGYGTRLGDLTRKVPKPMLMLQQRPLLEYVLGHIARHGFSDIVINLHYKPDLIRDYFGDGSRWNFAIRYSHEKDLLGTAGALTKVSKFLTAGEMFLVHYGDVLTDQDLTEMRRFHKMRNRLVTVLVHQRLRSNSAVTMDQEDRIIGFLERPSDEERRAVGAAWVNSGVYVCSPEFLDNIPLSKYSDIPRDVLPKLVPSGRVYGFRLGGYRCAIDSVERLAEARAAISSGCYRLQTG